MSGLRRRLASRGSQVLVGRTGGGRLAFLVIMTLDGMPNCRHRAELSKGVVHPDYRGRRCVQLAFTELVRRAESLGIEQFVLDVREGSRVHGARHRGHFMVQPVASLRARLGGDARDQRRRGSAMPKPPAVFKEELRSLLHSHLTLSHPIFRELLDPHRPNLELLRKVTLQGYQLTRHFLDYVEHLFFHCPAPKFKRALLINVYEEETGRLSRSDNHVALMQKFIRALGIGDDRRDAEVALPATRALIDDRLAAVRDRERYHVGAAAVMIASEGQNLETRAGEARHELLGKVYGLAETDLLFFSVHQAEDVGHVEQGLNLVAELCTTEAMQREALAAVDHTCKLFYAMYENMYQAFCLQADVAAAAQA